jgi:hypothetical protein
VSGERQDAVLVAEGDPLAVGGPRRLIAHRLAAGGQLLRRRWREGLLATAIGSQPSSALSEWRVTRPKQLKPHETTPSLRWEEDISQQKTIMARTHPRVQGHVRFTYNLECTRYMSSVARGDAFEKRVFDAITHVLAQDGLGLSPKHATVHWRKPYFSRDRDADIIVDVSIEVWLPGAPNYSFLWVCECKDYTGRLAINEVEEFKAKLDQIAGVNKKGILAITGALQRSAFNYARSQGIGVLRLLPDDQIVHKLHMSRAEREDRVALVEEAITEPSYIGNRRDVYAEINGACLGSWEALVTKALTCSKPMVDPEDR